MSTSILRPDGGFQRIDEVPAYWAQRTPNAIALLEGASQVSYRAFHERIGAARQILLEHGVVAGHRVLFVAENSVALIAFMFAASAIGACSAVVNARLSGTEIDLIAEHSEPQAILYFPAGFDAAQKHAGRAGAQMFAHQMFGTFYWVRAASPTAVEPGGEEVAALIYTSGTTGKPKGVMLTQRNLLFIAQTLTVYRRMSAADRSYGVLPMSHTMGLTSVLLSTLVAGGSVLVAPRFEVGAFADVLETDGITMFQGVQAMYSNLLSYLSKSGRRLATHSLRYIYAGGSPLDPTLKSQVEQLFGLPLHNGYGMTESAPTICHTRLGEQRADSAVGPPIPGIEIRIVDVSGECAGGAQAGELWVKGPNVMRGYFRDTAASAAAVVDGWLRTGDLVKRDAMGNVYLVGRLKDVIIRSGFNVYPAEVERALNEHPAVDQSAVVGRMAALNEEVVAFVKLRQAGAASASDLMDFLKLRLSPYKRPSEIIFLAAMPALPSGKIRKSELKELAQQGGKSRSPR